MKVPFSATGHRPSKLYDAYPEQKGYFLLVAYAEYLLTQYKDEIEIMYSGMAIGWDMAIAQACINLNIPFVACIPFKGQELLWPKRTQVYWKNLLIRSCKVVYVCDPGYCSVKMQKCNEYMVDHSRKSLALWDGTKGGTANCCSYAKSKEVEIISCWDGYVAGLKSVGITL